jgi:uroporphyrinogen III methyltransferase / synthase
MSSKESSGKGRVILVGAGPGNSRLLTQAAQSNVLLADVLIVDRLARSALEMLPPWPRGEPEIIDVGKCPGSEGWTQERINALLVEKAQEGKCVVRLKGGDPLVFGRAVEEVQACQRAGIECTIIPGLSSALAAPTLAGIPLTLRGVSSSFHVMTGKLAEGEDEERHWQEAAKLPGTLVILMGVKALPRICEGLLAGGKDPETPAAIIERASLPDQRTSFFPLKDLASEAEKKGVEAPAVTVLGDVVSHCLPISVKMPSESLLEGRTVAVTTSPIFGLDNELASWIRDQRASVSELPLHEYSPVTMDRDERNSLITRMKGSDILLFSSQRSAVVFFHESVEEGRCSPVIGDSELIAVGPSTCELIEMTLRRSCTQVPDPGGVAGLKKLDVDFGGKRVLWLRGREARSETRTVLEERGATVEEAILYEGRFIEENRDRLIELLRHRALDAVTFGSARGVEAVFADLPEEERRSLTEGVCLAVIGPATARALDALGLQADLVPPETTHSALAEALIDHFSAKDDAP